MKKQDLIKSIIPNKTYTGNEIRSMVNSIEKDVIVIKHFSPSKIKKGDVFIYTRADKKRPCVVIKNIKDKSICITMSTTEDFMNINIFNCRIFGENFFNFNIFMCENKYIENNFVGCIEDKKSLNIAIKMIKEQINKIR